MGLRLLHFRVTFAAVAVIALVIGAIQETAWLAVPGAVAGAIAELIGAVQCRARFERPTERTLRGLSEFLPAIGVAAFEPLAIGVSVVIVSYTLAANGMSTVAISRDVILKRSSGETLRKLLGGLAGLALLTIPVAATTGYSFAGIVGTTTVGIVAVAFAVVLLACLRALLDMAFELRKA